VFSNIAAGALRILAVAPDDLGRPAVAPPITLAARP
jgi:hypothetical protein